MEENWQLTDQLMAEFEREYGPTKEGTGDVTHNAGASRGPASLGGYVRGSLAPASDGTKRRNVIRDRSLPLQEDSEDDDQLHVRDTLRSEAGGNGRNSRTGREEEQDSTVLEHDHDDGFDSDLDHESDRKMRNGSTKSEDADEDEESYMPTILPSVTLPPHSAQGWHYHSNLGGAGNHSSIGSTNLLGLRVINTSPFPYPYAQMRGSLRTSAYNLDDYIATQGSKTRQDYALDNQVPVPEPSLSPVIQTAFGSMPASGSSSPPSGGNMESDLSIYLRWTKVLGGWNESSLGRMSTRSSPSQEPIAFKLPTSYMRQGGIKKAARNKKARRKRTDNLLESTHPGSRETTPMSTSSSKRNFNSSTPPTSSPTSTPSKPAGPPSTVAQTSGAKSEILHHRTSLLDGTDWTHSPEQHTQSRRKDLRKFQKQRNISMGRTRRTNQTAERSSTMPYASQPSNPPDAIMRSLIAELSGFNTNTSPMLSSRLWTEENRNTIYTIMQNAIGFNSQDRAYLSKVVPETELYPVRVTIIIPLSIADEIFFSV